MRNSENIGHDVLGTVRQLILSGPRSNILEGPELYTKNFNNVFPDKR